MGLKYNQCYRQWCCYTCIPSTPTSALPECKEETWGRGDKDSYQSECRCLVERGHNRIPKVLLAGRTSLIERRGRKEAWRGTGIGVVCAVVVVGGPMARVLELWIPSEYRSIQHVLDTCWCGDKERKAITSATRQTQLASRCLSTCYSGNFSQT